MRTTAIAEGGDSCNVNVEIGIRWVSKPNFLVSGQIKAASIKNMSIAAKSWLDKVNSDIGDLLVNNAGAKKKKKVGINEEKNESSSLSNSETSPPLSSPPPSSPSKPSPPIPATSSSSFVHSNTFLASYALLYVLLLFIAFKVARL